MPIYEERQTCWWVDLLLLIAIGAFVVLGWYGWNVFSGFSNVPRWVVWQCGIMGGVAIVFFGVMLGGMRLSIDADRVRVRWGWLRIPCLWIWRKNIVAVETHDFGSVRNGGYSVLRYDPRWGWVCRLAKRGVKIITKAGRRICISSNDPERVVALLQTTPVPLACEGERDG